MATICTWLHSENFRLFQAFHPRGMVSDFCVFMCILCQRLRGCMWIVVNTFVNPWMHNMENRGPGPMVVIFWSLSTTEVIPNFLSFTSSLRQNQHFINHKCRFRVSEFSFHFRCWKKNGVHPAIPRFFSFNPLHALELNVNNHVRVLYVHVYVYVYECIYVVCGWYLCNRRTSLIWETDAWGQ